MLHGYQGIHNFFISEIKISMDRHRYDQKSTWPSWRELQAVHCLCISRFDLFIGSAARLSAYSAWSDDRGIGSQAAGTEATVARGSSNRCSGTRGAAPRANDRIGTIALRVFAGSSGSIFPPVPLSVGTDSTASTA